MRRRRTTTGARACGMMTCLAAGQDPRRESGPFEPQDVPIAFLPDKQLLSATLLLLTVLGSGVASSPLSLG